MHRGFTLIEMMVSIGIFTFVTILVLVRFGTFENSVIITGEAYNIALNIRQAQAYGINVRAGTNDIDARAETSDEFTKPYGVHIDLGVNNQMYMLFQDLSATYNTDTLVITPGGWNGSHNQPCGSGGNKECVERRVTRNNTKIHQLCLKPFGGSLSCNPNMVNIVFRRPSPKAIIFTNNTSTTYEEAQIVVSAADPTKGRSRITVSWTGEISVAYEKD